MDEWARDQLRPWLEAPLFCVINGPSGTPSLAISTAWA
jgi:hypothetical protein